MSLHKRSTWRTADFRAPISQHRNESSIVHLLHVANERKFIPCIYDISNSRVRSLLCLQNNHNDKRIKTNKSTIKYIFLQCSAFNHRLHTTKRVNSHKIIINSYLSLACLKYVEMVRVASERGGETHCARKRRRRAAGRVECRDVRAIRRRRQYAQHVFSARARVRCAVSDNVIRQDVTDADRLTAVECDDGQRFRGAREPIHADNLLHHQAPND
jgi:hypothetical protein